MTIHKNYSNQIYLIKRRLFIYARMLRFLLNFQRGSFHKKQTVNLCIASLITLLIHFPLFIYFHYYDSKISIHNTSPTKATSVHIWITPQNNMLQTPAPPTENTSEVAFEKPEPVASVPSYYEAEALDVRPKMISQFEVLSRAPIGSSGSILKIKLWINATGSVDDYEVLENTLSNEELASVINNIKHSKFRPGSKNGINVPTTLIGSFEEQ